MHNYLFTHKPLGWFEDSESISIQAKGPLDAVARLLKFLKIEPQGVCITLCGDNLTLEPNNSERGRLVFGDKAEMTLQRMQ